MAAGAHPDIDDNFIASLRPQIGLHPPQPPCSAAACRVSMPAMAAALILSAIGSCLRRR